jgi:hypothetical protein
MYDNTQIALTLRSDYQRVQRDARLHLADLLGAGDDSGLARAAELYTALCGEDPEDERLWIGLFRVYERAGDLLGLGRAERQLRQSLVELAPSSVNVNPDTVTLPPKLDRLLQDIRLRLSAPSSAPTSA